MDLGGIRQTFRYKNIQRFVCFLLAVSVELIEITSPTNFKGCIAESQSVFSLYLSVTVTANLTCYSFDLNFPSRPLKDHGETSLFSFRKQGNICPEQWCNLPQGQEYAVNPRAYPIHCNMLLQPGFGDWNCFSAPCHGCGVVPQLCMFWPSLGTAAVHRRTERQLHYSPQYPEYSSFSHTEYKYAPIL